MEEGQQDKHGQDCRSPASTEISQEAMSPVLCFYTVETQAIKLVMALIPAFRRCYSPLTLIMHCDTALVVFVLEFLIDQNRVALSYPAEVQYILTTYLPNLNCY